MSVLALMLFLVACEEAAPPEVEIAPPTACTEPILVPIAPTNTAGTTFADASSDAVGADPTPRSLHLGIHADPARDAAFVWTTDPATLSSVVRIGSEPDLGETQIKGASYLDSTGSLRIHEVRVCGLSPSTDYTYKAGGVGGWSSSFSIRTAPATPDAAVRVAVAGDSRDSPETWDTILAAMAAHRPDFILFTGDAVAEGYDQELWNDWYAAGAGVVERIPIVMVHGNHEALALNYFANVSMPGNEQYFDLDWGPVHVVVLNDTVANSDDEAAENTFLAQSFANTERPWRIAAHHQPLWSASGHGSEVDRRDTWGKVFDAWPHTWVFNGHNHLYERSVPIRYGKADESGTVYVVAGSAGAPEYASRRDWYTAVSETTVHYVMMDFSPSRSVLRTFRADGSILDSLAVGR